MSLSPSIRTPTALRGVVRPRGSFTARNRAGEAMQIFVYDLTSVEPPQASSLRLTSESGETVRYCGPGHYLAGDGRPYQSDDPAAP